MASRYKSMFLIGYYRCSGVYLPVIHPIWNFIKYEYWRIITHKWSNLSLIIPIIISFLWLNLHPCTSLYVFIIIHLHYEHHLITHKFTTEVRPFLCQYFHFALCFFDIIICFSTAVSIVLHHLWCHNCLSFSFSFGLASEVPKLTHYGMV